MPLAILVGLGSVIIPMLNFFAIEPISPTSVSRMGLLESIALESITGMLSILEGITNNYIINFIEDNEGNKWFGTWNGISKFDGNTWENFFIEDGLPSNNTTFIYQDQENRIWAGTDKGISKFDGNEWQIIGKSDSL